MKSFYLAVGLRPVRPRAAVLAVAGGVGAVEPFEYPGDAFGSDSLAIVGDGDRQPVAVADTAEFDRTARWSVPQRILEQIAQDSARVTPKLWEDEHRLLSVGFHQAKRLWPRCERICERNSA